MNQVQDFYNAYTEAEECIKYLTDMLARLYALHQSVKTKLMVETALDHVGAADPYQRTREEPSSTNNLRATAVCAP